jgi:hypothetical protein
MDFRLRFFCSVLTLSVSFYKKPFPSRLLQFSRRILPLALCWRIKFISDWVHPALERIGSTSLKRVRCSHEEKVRLGRFEMV